MPKKPKYNPQITRVKLNPEQAVLQCACYQGSLWGDGEWAANAMGGWGCSGKEWSSRYVCDSPQQQGNPYGYEWSEQTLTS